MPLLRVSLALSLDGYIADKDGAVRWLDPYFSPEIDFIGFFSSIGAIIMGRTTFDQAIKMEGWHYSGMPCFVMTRRPAPGNVPAGIEFFSGDVRDLATKAKLAAGAKDVWHMGGGQSILPFRQAGLIDRWELSFIPVFLGKGVPLFPPGNPILQYLKLTSSKALSNGIVSVVYEPAPGPPPPPPAPEQKKSGTN